MVSKLGIETESSLSVGDCTPVPATQESSAVALGGGRPALGVRRPAEKRSYVKGESPKPEDPVVRSCPLGQELPQRGHEGRVV